MDIAYIGYSDVLLNHLLQSQDFNLIKVVYVEDRVSKKYKNLLEKNNLQNLKITSKDDICKINKFFENIEIILMYKFEYILPQRLINMYRIFNFHGGCLRTNRGAHAVVRSILNGDKETMLSLYELTGGIDIGLLIGEYCVPISKDETVNTLNAKLQEGILPLLSLLKKYLDGEIEAVLVKQGIYYPKVMREDYTLDIKNDSFEKMDAILRSQVDYNGAICCVDGCEVWVKRWKIEEHERYFKRNIYCEKDKIIIEDFGKKMTMYIEE